MDVLSFIDEVYNKEVPQLKVKTTCEFFCSHCKANRKMQVIIWQHKGHVDPYPVFLENYEIKSREEINKEAIDSLFPSLWIAECKQCETQHYVILYKIDNVQRIMLLSDSLDGVSTPNTPTAVRYYLDQAYKAQMIGANSACISMYRAALEQILYEQGFTKGMLKSKIEQLEDSINKHCSPKWATSVDSNLFKYIKGLGDGSIHPNNGDISVQSALDNDLVITINLLFEEFLDEIYEKPKREASRKQLLSDAANKFRR